MMDSYLLPFVKANLNGGSADVVAEGAALGLVEHVRIQLAKEADESACVGEAMRLLDQLMERGEPFLKFAQKAKKGISRLVELRARDLGLYSAYALGADNALQDFSAPSSGYDHALIPRTQRMIDNLVSGMAEAGGLTPGDIKAVVLGHGGRPVEVMPWLKAGAETFAVDTDADARVLLNARMARRLKDEPEMAPNFSAVSGNFEGEADIVQAVHPKRGKPDDVDPTIEELTKNVRRGGLFIVQTDFPERYVAPLLEGGTMASDFEVILHDPSVDPENYYFPSVHLDSATGSVFFIARRK